MKPMKSCQWNWLTASQCSAPIFAAPRRNGREMWHAVLSAVGRWDQQVGHGSAKAAGPQVPHVLWP